MATQRSASVTGLLTADTTIFQPQAGIKVTSTTAAGTLQVLVVVDVVGGDHGRRREHAVRGFPWPR